MPLELEFQAVVSYLKGWLITVALSCVRRPVLPRRQGSDQIPLDLSCTPLWHLDWTSLCWEASLCPMECLVSTHLVS